MANNTVNALPSLYFNTTPNLQQIWYNLENTLTSCQNVGSFNLVVHPLPVVTQPAPMYQCSNGATNVAEFNLSLNDATVTGGLAGYIVTYHNTLAQAQAGTPSVLPSANEYMGTDGEIIYIRVEDATTGCYATTTLELHVTQGPVAITPLPLHYCDPNNDGIGFFDLASTINEISGGSLPAGVSVTFHETQQDAILGANAIPTATLYENIDYNQQTIYVRVFYTLTDAPIMLN